MGAEPKYRKPEEFLEVVAPVPRVVNARWLMLALRDNARAVDRGEFYPWDPAMLDRRVATFLEQQVRAGKAF